MDTEPTSVELPHVDPSLAAAEAALHPHARALCVDCDGLLIAKCGEINRWHWAHEADDSTCVGTDGEGAWHRAWKAWATNEGAKTEVRDGRHRADVVWSDGRVYELQSGYLDAFDIRAREGHYGDKLTWIYRITPGRMSRLRNVGQGWFRWQRPAPSMWTHRAPVIWHYADRLFAVTLESRAEGLCLCFERGEPDEYGPVLYGSRPAPFDVGDAVDALGRFGWHQSALEAS